MEGVEGRLRMAGAAAIFVVALLAVNFCYGLTHETGHALAIDALGGHVYSIRVDALGTDAYTVHSTFRNVPDTVLVEAAGLCATTLLALAFAAAGQGFAAAFFAARTAIYALDYAPGTDISTIHAVAGPAAIWLSLALVAINFACIALAANNSRAGIAAAWKKLVKGPFSS